MREVVVRRLVGERRSIIAASSRFLEGPDNQRDRGFPSVTLHFYGRGLFLKHDGNDLITEPIADPAEPQSSTWGIGQSCAANGSENGVGDINRSWSPDAEHRDGAAAFCR